MVKLGAVEVNIPSPWDINGGLQHIPAFDINSLFSMYEDLVSFFFAKNELFVRYERYITPHY